MNPKRITLNNKDDIEAWLYEMNITNYFINENLTVDVNASVYLSDKNLTFIPIQFGIVSGDFFCDGNNLTSLLGLPHLIKKDLYCNHNKLTSLEGLSKEIHGAINCSNNPIQVDSYIESQFKVLIHYCNKETEKIELFKPMYQKLNDYKLALSNEQFQEMMKPLKEKEILEANLTNQISNKNKLKL